MYSPEVPQNGETAKKILALLLNKESGSGYEQGKTYDIPGGTSVMLDDGATGILLNTTTAFCMHVDYDQINFSTWVDNPLQTTEVQVEGETKKVQSFRVVRDTIEE